MQRYGLIGFPISHSLSPELFEAAYGGRFRYDLLEYESFDEAFRVFMKSYSAVNVTAPFKEQACEKAKIRSRECEILGAANILVKTPNGVSCFNSDCTGVRSLLEDCLARHGRETVRGVLVAGCGGAGKAAALAAYGLGLDVTIVNRNISKALSFAQRLNDSAFFFDRTGRTGGAPSRRGTATVLPIESLPQILHRHDILIYTIPSPLKCLSDGRPVLPKVIIEANYRNPSFTPEVLSRSSGTVEYIPGERWLLQQALTGYGLMTGVNPDPNLRLPLRKGDEPHNAGVEL